MSHAHGRGDWDEHALQYDAVMALIEPILGHVTTALLDAVDAGPGTRVLDLACGPGHTTAAATERGALSLGIDLSAQMVNVARRRFPATEFQVGNMLTPPAGPWDAIVCRFGVHHVDPAWLPAAWKALRPGGRLALAELGANGAQAQANGMQNPHHWASLLTAAGFTDVRIQEHTIDLSGNARRHPELAAIVAQGQGRQFQGPAYIIQGSKPDQ